MHQYFFAIPNPYTGVVVAMPDSKFSPEEGTTLTAVSRKIIFFTRMY